MNDDRIERALRKGSPGEPTYVAQLTPADLRGVARRPAATGRLGLKGSLRSLGRLVEAVSLVAVVVGVVLLRQGALDPAAKPSSLLAAVQGRGVIRIAVRPDRPQVTVPGGSRSGFDVDVATELGRRLGLRVELVFMSPDRMLAGSDGWDIAMPSTAVERGSFVTTSPYYDWPVRLVAAPGSPATTPGDLSGSTICVVTGSSGAAWLDGSFRGASATPVAQPPSPATVRRLASDDVCASDVAAGSSSAFVTAGWSDADIAARPTLVWVGGPVLTEARPVIAVPGVHDPTGLIARLDEVLAAMRADGTLTHLSQGRFGGLDLTQSPSP